MSGELPSKDKTTRKHQEVITRASRAVTQGGQSPSLDQETEQR